jgi:hypothetical protein
LGRAEVGVDGDEQRCGSRDEIGCASGARIRCAAAAREHERQDREQNAEPAN